MREGTREDFERFCVYSMHIRYLQIQDGILPSEVLEDYMRLFPHRPILPLVRSINILMRRASCLPYLLRSLTPAENQVSVSESMLRTLSIYRDQRIDRWEEDESPARDLAAFQHSNGRFGTGLK